MKREIKFRVWHNDEMYLRWDKKGEIVIRNGGYIILEKPSTWFLGGGELIGLDKAVLMQYTGFKDKNYKEIYEGDIVNVEKENGEKYNAQVRFFNGAFCIYTSNLDINVENVKGHNVLIHIDFDWEEYQPFYEVIGNIYENGGLLAVTPKV